MSYKLLGVGSYIMMILFGITGILDTLLSLLTWNFRGTHYACAFSFIFLILGKLCFDKEG